MSKQSKKSTYPGGFTGIVNLMEKRMDPMVYADGEALPPLDIDLSPFKARRMDASAPELQGSRSGYARKYRDLAKEFDGQPALLHLHGLLVANLRRKSQPLHTAALFSRLWSEEADFLLDHLDTRWLVSAVTTFGDHGLTPAERQLGQALSVMFGMMKLYETERLYSGHTPDQAFAPKDRSAKTLAMQMDAYSVTSGGLDVNLLGGLWQQAETLPVLRPLAQRLLSLLIEDDKTVFRRLRTMREKRLKVLKKKGVRLPSGRKTCVVDVPSDLIKPDGQMQTWGTVTLAKAPLEQLAGFAAYHLDLGASDVAIYLDAPNSETKAFLERNPKVHVIPCDDAYWAAQKKPRMKAHQMRQAWVATQAYQHARVDWLAHIDVDEFLLPSEDGPNAMQTLLAAASPKDAALHLPPAELLANSPQHDMFKLLPEVGRADPFPAEAVYPNFGATLRHGFVSHRTGKNIARTGLDGIRLGIHEMLHGGRVITNRTQPPGAFLGHAHAPNWESFRANMQFRLTRGSYRKSDEEKLQLADILGFMLDEKGEDGLRQFFNEVCEATPTLVQALEEHGMLLRRDLDLQHKIQRHFGAVPAVSGRST